MENTKKKNWIIAIAVAIIYLAVSILFDLWAFSCRRLRAGVSERYFIIPPVRLSVLLIIKLFRSFISALAFH